MSLRCDTRSEVAIRLPPVEHSSELREGRSFRRTISAIDSALSYSHLERSPGPMIGVRVLPAPRLRRGASIYGLTTMPGAARRAYIFTALWVAVPISVHIDGGQIGVECVDGTYERNAA